MWGHVYCTSPKGKKALVCIHQNINKKNPTQMHGEHGIKIMKKKMYIIKVLTVPNIMELVNKRLGIRYY